FATVRLKRPVPLTALTRTLRLRCPQTVAERVSVRAPAPCTRRVDDAKTSTTSRIPAEPLRVTFIVPSRAVGTEYDRVRVLRVSEPVRELVVGPCQGVLTSWSSAVSALSLG